MTGGATQPGRGGLLQDWAANRGRPGIRLVLVLFRATQLMRGNAGGLRRLLAAPVQLLYRLVALSFFGIDIPARTRVGRGLAIHHGMGLVVNADTCIGDHVTLRHNTTLGSRRTDSDCPVLGTGVDIGPNSVLLGPISVGDGARVGAGSVVLHDVPAAASVAGNPARLLIREQVTSC